VFDADYKPTRAFRFELAGADYRDALHALQAATDSFLVPISQRLIFVANDSTQKRTEFERTAAIAVPFPEALSVQELQEIATGIRGALDSQKLMVDTTQHLILIRDKGQGAAGGKAAYKICCARARKCPSMSKS
jgi:hypothetical protein